MSAALGLEMGGECRAQYQDLSGWHGLSLVILVFRCQCGAVGQLADSQLLLTSIGVFAECEKCQARFEVDLN